MKYLEKELVPENVAVILEQCLLYEESTLKKKCLTMVEEHTPQVFRSTAFLQVSIDTLCAMLELDVMTISEMELFNRVMEWAKHAQESQRAGGELDGEDGVQTLRQALGRALYLVRIPCLKLEDFANEVLPKNVLTMEEENTIFRYFTQRNKPNQIQFVSTPRSESSVYLELGSEEFTNNVIYPCKSMVSFFNCPPIKLRDIFVFCPVSKGQPVTEDALAGTTLEVEIADTNNSSKTTLQCWEFQMSPLAIHGYEVMRFNMDANQTKEIEWLNWSLIAKLKLPDNVFHSPAFPSIYGPDGRVVKNYQLGRKKLTFCSSSSGIIGGLSFLFCE